MKHKFPLIPFHVVCISILLAISPMAQEYDWASIDEERFESFQPTNKIMDIIGVKKGMKVGGRLAIIELKRYGRADSNEIINNAGLAGYKLIKVDDSLPRDDIYLFEIK